MPRRWRISTLDPAQIDSLQNAAGVPTVVAKLLLCRGIDEPADARAFLDPKLSGLRDPEQLPGLPKAADFLHGAIERGDRIVIFGDYDADGMTATAILMRCFKTLGGNAGFYIPHRLEEGYGLNSAALEQLAADGVKVVVTVDNGIASLEAADRARELGLQLVVTDHHQMAERLPVATAIVHPGLPGHDYPFAGLCGAAVAFKLACAICQRAAGAKKVTERMRRYLLRAIGLAAIGSVADVVPLVDENRILVRQGLRQLRDNPIPGIVALEQIASLTEKPELQGEDIGFAIAPRLNAAGRMGQADLGVELLTTDSAERATELAGFLDELNQQRQTVERSVLLAARKQIKHQFDAENDPAFVLADRDWHPGVIGIVAGKLTEQYNRPVVLISLDKLGLKPGIGSGRSVAGFNLGDAFVHCTEHLISHGGHAAAAGLRVEELNIDALRIEFCAYAVSQQDAMQDAGELWIDAETPLSALTHQTVSQMEQLAPFGHGNRRPVLCASGVRLASPPRRMGGAGRHLSLELEQYGVKLRAVAFGAGDREQELAATQGPLEVAFKPIINTFRGWRTVEVHLEDWRVAEDASETS